MEITSHSSAFRTPLSFADGAATINALYNQMFADVDELVCVLESLPAQFG